MPKNSREQIELDEKKVLSELVKNSRASIETIAKHCGFSRQRTWKLIKQIEEKGLIWGYTAIVDEEKQGLKKFILLLKRSMKRITNETADQIASHRVIKEYIKLGINVESSYYILGEYDWILIFTAPDLQTAKRFCDSVLREYPDLIINLNLVQVLTMKRSHNIVNPDSMVLRNLL